MLDIATLRVIWWLLIGALLMGFAITDGFDFGTAILMPFVAKDEKEKNTLLDSILPVWEGNQVWIILGAGALFAAWPYVYAVAFSGAYFPVLLLLLTMGIARPVSFKYRNKVESSTWRRNWDIIIFLGGCLPALLFGILIGNIIQGLAFTFDDSLRITYTGSMISLINPFALWCGFTSLAMLTMHGGLYLTLKTNNPIAERARNYSIISAILLLVFFIVGGIWIAHFVTGFQLLHGGEPFGYSNPLSKQVKPLIGGWINNYSVYPYAVLAPLLGIFSVFAVIMAAKYRYYRLAFMSSCMSIIGVISTVGVSMFPFILPSNTDQGSSLLVWDASSSQLTLLLMLAAVIIFIPIICGYTTWVYRVMSRNPRES